MKKLLLMLCLTGIPGVLKAATDPLSVEIAGTTFILPLQKVDATQLYSFRDKKGYPGAETTLAQRGKFKLTFGAAPVLGSSNNVPFVSLQTRLSEAFFDTSNNALLFGIWAGKESGRKRGTWGIKASVPLW